MHKRVTALTAAAVLASASAVGLVAAPAAANPQATAPYGTFTCSDGRTVDIFGIAVPRFPTQVGFIGGKGAVARWFGVQDTGAVTILDGAHAGEVFAIDNAFTGPANRSRRASPPDLSTLATCTGVEDYRYDFALDQESADFLGLDASYLGAQAHVEGTSSTTVWINAVQLAHR